MSSLTNLGYTATQYALLSSTYAWLGKILKGFSGAEVESLSTKHGLIHAYGIFFIACGLTGVPAVLLFAALGYWHRRKQSGRRRSVQKLDLLENIGTGLGDQDAKLR